MTEDKRVLHSFMELLPEKTYGEDNTILVADTSLLFALSNFHAWTIDINDSLVITLEKQGKRLELRMPPSVADQYNGALAKGRLDEFSIPLASRPLEEIINDFGDIQFSTHPQIPDEARFIWNQYQEGKKQPRRNTGTTLSAGRADNEVIAYALACMKAGADVYVGSSDFKDIIGPVRKFQEEYRKQGFRLTAMPPSPLHQQYLRVEGKKIDVFLTGEVIAALQPVKRTGFSYPIVIFEKEVTSGDHTFDVGVGVERREYFRNFQLPDKYSCIADNVDLVPVVKVKSLNGSDKKPLYNALSENKNSRRFVVINEQQPHLSLMYYPNRTNAWMPMLRADLNFLHYNSNSVFAHHNYKPMNQR